MTAIATEMERWAPVVLKGLTAASASAGLVQAVRAGPGDAAGRLAPVAGSMTAASVLALDQALGHAGLSGGRRAAILIGAVSAAGAGVAVLSGGNRAYASALGWGLAGVALTGLREKRPALVAAAGVGLAALVAASWYAARPAPPSSSATR